MALFTQYFEAVELYESKYGPNTIVLIQNGKFFECFGDGGELNYAATLAALLDIRLAQRTGTTLRVVCKGSERVCKDPPMCGFPVMSLQKNLDILLANNYTVVCITQLEEKKGTARQVERVYSPGTVASETAASNKLLAFVIEGATTSGSGSAINKGWVVGVAVIDLVTGWSTLGELYINELNELYKFSEIHRPREVLVYTDCADLSAAGITTGLVHMRSLGDIGSVRKVSFQDAFFEKLFGKGIAGAEMLLHAQMAYVLMIMFVNDHCPQLMTRLQAPCVYQDDKYLLLYNNALEQLNVVNTEGKSEGKTEGKKSLLDIVCRTSTVMGRRALEHDLTHPVVDADELERRYVLVESYRSIEHIVEIESYLRGVVDLERFVRKIMMGSLRPFELANAYPSLRAVGALFAHLGRPNEAFDAFVAGIDERFLLDKLASGGCGESFVRGGINAALDRALAQRAEIRQMMEARCSAEIKLEETDCGGIALITTAARARKMAIQTEKYKGGKVRLCGGDLDDADARYVHCGKQIETINASEFAQWLSDAFAFVGAINAALGVVIEVDCYKSRAKVAIENGYIRPIVKCGTSSFIRARDLRHPIVERINTREKYIGNDLSIGRVSHIDFKIETEIVGDKSTSEEGANTDDVLGLLLYGLNASGKTVFSKSVALNVILAQSGHYVAASSFEFGIYKKIFARITGNDNMYRGESSFAVEMNELNSILRYADNRSLVLGDEICRGTEHPSALAIVAASIEKFGRSAVQFIFATHLHELTTLVVAPTVRFCHLDVDISSEFGIVYNRKLREGTGEKLYGLEVAKYIIRDDDEFIQSATKIRNKILGNEVRLLQGTASKYNADVYVHQCQIGDCRETPLDVHHIQFQCTFDNTWELARNAEHNLVVLCKAHHEAVHRGALRIDGYKRTGDGLVLAYESVEQVPGPGPGPGRKAAKYTDAQLAIIRDYKNKYGAGGAVKMLMLEQGIKITKYSLGKL